MESRISFLVCSNGYGHLKRVLLVVKEILRLKPEQSITLFCKDEHREFVKREINFQSNYKINYDNSLSKNEISWLSTSSVNLTQYQKWADELLANQNFQSSSLVISDNHVLPVRMHPNAILMGSFLWHDVTQITSLDIEDIKEDEVNFLLEHKPELICVGDMVMPRIVYQTNPLRMPWFCTKYKSEKNITRRNSFLVTGGGTELLNDTLLQIVESVSRSNPGVCFFLDSKLYLSATFKARDNIQLFGFEDDQFASLSGVICRPGVGILTDCVRYDLPVIALNDAYNSEIIYNSSRVKHLAIGESLASYNTSIESLSSIVSGLINDKNQLSKYINRLKAIRVGGATHAAKIILQKLNIHE